MDRGESSGSEGGAGDSQGDLEGGGYLEGGMPGGTGRLAGADKKTEKAVKRAWKRLR